MQHSDELLIKADLEEVKTVDTVDKFSISSTDRLKEMLDEAEKELSAIQPEMEALEKSLLRLQELKQTKQKLITLKLSIQSILNNYTGEKLNKRVPEFSENLVFSNGNKLSKYSSMPQMKHFAKLSTKATFYPDLAFEKAGLVLKQKTSLNYELFRAIVFSGGRASTQTIKQYLLDHKLTLPGSGESFDAVPLTDISARVNYLIRKGLVTPDGRGYFRTTVGWDDDDAADEINAPETEQHPAS